MKWPKTRKKSLKLQDFIPYFKLLALKHTWQALSNTTMNNTHDDYKSLNNKITIVNRLTSVPNVQVEKTRRIWE